MPVSSIIKPAVSMPCFAPAQNPTTRMRQKSGGRNQIFTISPATSLMPWVHNTHKCTRNIHNHASSVTGSHRWKEQSHKRVKNREICRNIEPAAASSLRPFGFVVSDALQSSRSKRLISSFPINSTMEPKNFQELLKVLHEPSEKKIEMLEIGRAESKIGFLWSSSYVWRFLNIRLKWRSRMQSLSRQTAVTLVA